MGITSKESKQKYKKTGKGKEAVEMFCRAYLNNLEGKQNV